MTHSFQSLCGGVNEDTEVQEESCGDTELRGQEESYETLAGQRFRKSPPTLNLLREKLRFLDAHKGFSA